MYERDIEPVLRCVLCNKPFDKPSTLKRHGYYCRSRRTGDNTRARSCIFCAKRKARCDNKQPRCSRCTTKGIECRYPTRRPKESNDRIRTDDSVSPDWQETVALRGLDSLSVEASREVLGIDDLGLDSTLGIPELDFNDLSKDYFNWDDVELDFADILDPPSIDNALQSSSASLVRQSTTPLDRRYEIRSETPYSGFSILTQPFYNPRSLIVRQKQRKASQRTADLIMHTLKSYLLMMLRHNTLPPFIHPQMMSFDTKEGMEPLNNCMSLVHMIGSEIRGSRKLSWRNVRLECERFCAEYATLNKWELLAAMQALSIYTLIRLDEGPTDYNNFDSLLITAVTVIARQLASVDITYSITSEECNYDFGSKWEDWIFEESRRRICVVYQVVNMLAYWEPAAMCEHRNDLVLAPLPARKQLWEASDEVTWKSERDKDSTAQIDFGLASNGDLVKLRKRQSHYEDAMHLQKSETTANWEEWCSGMDSFGGIVMLAASLTGQ